MDCQYYDRHRHEHQGGGNLHERRQAVDIGQQPPQPEEPEQNDDTDPERGRIAPHLGADLLGEERAKHQRYSFRNRASRLME